MKILEKLTQRIKRKRDEDMEIERLLSTEEEEIEETVEERKIPMESPDDASSEATGIMLGVEEKKLPMESPDEKGEMLEDDLLKELMRDDVSSLEEDYSILKKLEDVTAEELTEDLNNLLRLMYKKQS